MLNFLTFKGVWNFGLEVKLPIFAQFNLHDIGVGLLWGCSNKWRSSLSTRRTYECHAHCYLLYNCTWGRPTSTSSQEYIRIYKSIKEYIRIYKSIKNLFEYKTHLNKLINKDSQWPKISFRAMSSLIGVKNVSSPYCWLFILLSFWSCVVFEQAFGGLLPVIWLQEGHILQFHKDWMFVVLPNNCRVQNWTKFFNLAMF